jgi:hypothetical protein
MIRDLVRLSKAPWRISYSLTHLPGTGTLLALNGTLIGVIDGADFAEAYFRIWLGDRPIDVSLRDQLLDCDRTAAEERPPTLRMSGAA